LDQEGEHLLAERVLHEGGLVGVAGAEHGPEAFGLGFDAALAASPLECGV
jgi:hypothetical protein